ncbi:hypothetical protein C0995_003970 [Termitomyces sp. Mi166|nr:hypothetical protein C0995_003970 [Termitomyces sp. Mi166\
MLNGGSLRPPSTTGSVADNIKAPMGQLNNVPALIERTQKALTLHIHALRAKACKDKSFSSHASPPSSGPLIRLYYSLTKQIGKKNGHLVLPTDIHLLENIIASDAESDQAELACIRNMHGSGVQGRTTSLHNSLYVALAILPLMLLNPREYTEVGAKETVFQLWNHIGGLERPSAIMAADRALWKVLFSAALGGVLHELDAAFR